MTAFNVVRFRVKPGLEKEFLKTFERDRPPGSRHLSVIKTGDRTYCAIGEWNNMKDIVAARPQMISNLDSMRHTLEDLGNGLGVTDPVSGDTVIELK